MNPSLLRCCAVLLLLGCGLFQMTPAHAGPTTCTATVTTLAFGNVNPQSSLTDTTATLTYTCTTTSNSNDYIAACFRIQVGPYDTANAHPRNMQAGAGQLLGYYIYQDSGHTTVWGANNGPALGKDYYLPLIVPARGSTTGTITMYGEVLGGQTTAVPGSYSETNTNGIINVVDGGSQYPANCNGGSVSPGNFTVTATATVGTPCTVSANPLNFGAVAAGTSNVTGTTSIGVTCAMNVAYNIGLTPGNNATNGAGSMIGQVYGVSLPYQLYQDAADSTVWGNLSTNMLTAANGLQPGTGALQSYTVYALAPNTNVTPDTYKDTVTVSVTY
jgi:spore coat protein U-like protein